MTPTPVSVAPCTAPVGPTVPISRDPLDMFSYYFDDYIIDLVVRETNRFADQTLADTTTTWETSAAEIKAYLGFQILMGINRLPEIRDYWAMDAKLHYSPIASRISRNRFEEITRYLHFVDNTDLPSRDEPGFHRLQKVLPVVVAMKERFLNCYDPHPQNSIDEAMIPFKGIYIMYIHIHVCINLDIIFMYIHVHMHVYTFRQVDHEAIHAQQTCEARVQGVGKG